MSIGPVKVAIKDEIRWRRDQTDGKKRHAISVVVERRFIDQCWTYDIGAVDHGCIGRIRKNCADRRNVIWAEDIRSIVL